MKVALLLLGLTLTFIVVTKVSGEETRIEKVRKTAAPRLNREFKEKGLTFGAPVFIRIFKEERELELWIEKGEKFVKFRTYPVVAMSGKLGPKLAEGDLQAPEGFYAVGPSAMLPTSLYHLAFNIGFPNAYDRKNGRTGSFIMVHGAQASVGCFAMTDSKIEEIYLSCERALAKGQPFFRVHTFPFRMTPERMARASGHDWEEFWKELQPGYDWFEREKKPPNVEMESGEYSFSASQ